MDLEGKDVLISSNEYAGEVDKSVTIDPDSIPGFEKPEPVSGTITGDGSLVLEIKYKRQKYNVTFIVNYPDNYHGNENGDLKLILPEQQYFGKPLNGMYKVEEGFETSKVYVNDENEPIETIPASDSVDVTIHVKTKYIMYTINYDYGGGDPSELLVINKYKISKSPTKLPIMVRDGYEFKGWKYTGDVVWESIPEGVTGDLNLVAQYSKLSVITIINWEVVSVISDHFVKQSNGIYVSKNSDGGFVTFNYEIEGETVYKWIINGKPIDSSGNQYKFEVKEDTIVFAYPKLKDTDSATLDVMRITLAFTKNVNGEYSATIDGSLTYDGFTIDLKKYGGTGENPSIQFTNDKKVNIKGLAGMTGTLFIKESSMKYNVEITLYIISNISDSDLRGAPIMTINDGRSNVFDHQTFSDYILPSEGGEVIE